mgnify:CR=1 FL=1
MELKIFRDTLPQGGAGCTVKAELPLETEIRISDDLPPVGKLVKCFVRPAVLQRQLQPGRLTLEGYLRCTVFYQSEAEKGLCQTEQKLPFTRQLELPELDFTAGDRERRSSHCADLAPQKRFCTAAGGFAKTSSPSKVTSLSSTATLRTPCSVRSCCSMPPSASAVMTSEIGRAHV